MKSKKPKVLILRTAGTNCDEETAFAFRAAGASADLVHINEFIRGNKKMSAYQIMAIPGGFSYGDDIASGKILANQLRFELKQEVGRFIKSGKLIIGICNGFQVLVKSGLLPALNLSKANGLGPGCSLTFNDSGRFQDEWVYLWTPAHQPRRFTSEIAIPTYEVGVSKCVWTKDLPDTIYLPIAHGEGKFVVKDAIVLKKLLENNQVVLQYVNNPNGSVNDIAGICDPTGRIFGLMPHPERHVSIEQHPRRIEEAGGLQIFKNAVEYAKNNL